MRLLVLAATNSWQGRIAGSRIACVGRPYHTMHSSASAGVGICLANLAKDQIFL